MAGIAMPMQSTAASIGARISVRLAAIEIIGNSEQTVTTERHDHFLQIYVDDHKVATSEKKRRTPTTRWSWHWQEDNQFLIHPSSRIKIAVYRQNRVLKTLIGQIISNVVELLENDALLDLKDNIGATLEPKIKISLSLVEPDIGIKIFEEAADANNSNLLTTDRASPGISALWTTLQLMKNIMDIVSDTPPILKASLTVMAVAYAGLQHTGVVDDIVRELAESLRKSLELAKKLPALLGKANVIEEIGRTSLEVSSLIYGYSMEIMLQILMPQLSDDMKLRIEQCHRSLSGLLESLMLEREKMQINTKTQISMVTIIDDQLAGRIFKWLSAPDSSRNLNRAHEQHLTGTSSWFFDGPRFRHWRETADFLWIKGKPGSGKTVLCATIVEEIMKLRQHQMSITYAYFFFDQRDSQHGLHLHDNLIRSLIWQLSLQCNDIPAVLLELHGHGYQQPSTASLEDALLRIIDGLEMVYMIIDALDECLEQEETLKWINCIALRKMSNLHVVVASRPERNISEVLEVLDPDYVDLAGAINQDIAMYLNEQVPLVNKWDGDTKEIVKSTLTMHAEGMFRWVVLQLMDLRKYMNRRQIMQQLNALPQGLYETYDQILFKIGKHHSTVIKQVLYWLCFSARPLTYAEITALSNVDFDVENGPQFLPHLSGRDKQDILGWCSGLVVEAEGRIILAHFSVKEYLMSEYLCMGALSGFHLASAETSHSLITQTCLAYLLQFSDFESTFASSPLADYAAQNWIFHARSGGIDQSEPSTTLKLAEKLFTNEAIFANWVRIWDLDQDTSTRYQYRTGMGGPLYYTSLAGLQRLSQYLLKEGADVNVQGGQYGNALQAASYGGYEAVVKPLLDRGADPNAQGGEYGTALAAAAYRGHEAIVKLLIENGADVNVQGGRYGNALQAALAEGHEAIVALLRDKGANQNMQGGLYHSALQAASVAQHGAIVKLLLKSGAERETQGGEYGNALQAASFRGDEGTVKLLLQDGADVNAQGGLYGNALQAASYQGDEATVKLLLEYGAESNVQGGHFGYALQAASFGGHASIVNLLQKEVDINALGGEYGNALQAASFGQNETIVKRLLELGADVNMQGGLYGNALQAASCQGHEGIVKLLLENGADVHMLGGFYGSALQAASVAGEKVIVTLLFKNGADVNAQGGEYGNALQAASAQGTEAIVKLLLEYGADVNAQGGFYGSALQAAACRGDEQILKLLLRMGADVNSQGGKYGNALRAASVEGHVAIVKLLREYGGC